MVGLSFRADRPRRGRAILTALVLGSAETLGADKAAALELFEPNLIIACNHAARDEPGRVDHWVTMHPDLFVMWLAVRRQNGFPDPGQFWHARHRPVPKGIESRAIESWGGSSGMLCVAVAVELGVERVVLAGVPMLKTARHYDDRRHWEEARGYWPAWERYAPRIRGRVKSMSGWTRDLLDAPTGEWLDGDRARKTAGAAR
jgi:hypothetical protein